MAIAIDRDLIDAARSGSISDIERLITAAWPDAFRLALAIAGDRQAAEDAAQEACINVYRAIGTLRSSAAFSTWFYRIVVREATAIVRARKRNESTTVVENTAVDETTHLDIWFALNRLPQSLRDVVVLSYFEDLRSRDVSAILRISDATVRFRLMLARRRLHSLLSTESAIERKPPTNEVSQHA